MYKLFSNAKCAALGIAAAAFSLVAAAPAQADKAAYVPAASAPAPGATLDTNGNDRQFQQLFASWEQLDRDEPATTSVSVPSRMPLDSARLSSDYGLRTHPVLGGRRSHNGVDLAAPTGTPVYATADGLVSRANWFSSYGNYIAIEHGAQLQTRFAHLSEIAVSEGDRVRKGDLIGYVGSTGRSTGPHLHYEVRIAGKPVNPTPYMIEGQAEHAFALATGEGGIGGGD